MTPREIVKRTITFGTPERLAIDLPEKYGSDFSGCGMNPSPDKRATNGVDEWGAVWRSIGSMHLGEVKEFPLKDWAEFEKLNVPDVREPHRWTGLAGARDRAGDRFLTGGGISLYERVHFIRGLENTWADIYENPERLGELIDILVDMNLYAVERYADEDVDGLVFCDDWGLQDRLMIPPDKWREIWMPRYAKVFEAAHKHGMLTLMHSCGHIVAIMDDLIEIGLDVIQMDQQENMGLELLGERFAGRIAFWCPVDIQATMAYGSPEQIRAYCRGMLDTLATPEGGLIYKWYGDPVGAGHTQENIDVMSEEMVKLSRDYRALKGVAPVT